MGAVATLLARPSARRIGYGLVLLAIFALPLVVPSEYRLFIATQMGVYLLVALGLNFLTGYGGQVSLGHGALVAVGSYAAGIAMVDHHWSFWTAAPLAMVAAALIGSLMALPAFRLSTWYFALITLGFAQVAQGLMIEWRGLTHGFAGLVGIHAPGIAGHALDARELYWLVAAVLVVCFVGLGNLIDSRFGRALVAVRDNPAAAIASGVSLARLKMFAFVLSAAIAGLAGALFAVQKTVITPDDFTADFSIFFLLIVVLGGSGRRWGPVVGTVVFFLVPELLTALQTWRLLIYGIALLALMLFAPHGLVGAGEGLWRRLAGSRPHSLPDLVDDTAAPAVEGVSVAVRGVEKRFGGVAALAGVSIAVESGSVHAIVGPNGSGKTTLLNLISGFYPIDGGDILLGEFQVRGRPAHQIARFGVGRTFQTPKLLPGLSVIENVMLGAFAGQRTGIAGVVLRLPSARRETHAFTATALRYLDFVGLRDRAATLAGELPHGQQRLVEIARALVGRPRLLLLDEPAAGLSLAELDRLAELIRAIHGLGVTVVVVEHHLELVASICSRVSVLDRGQVLASGTPGEVFSHGDVVQAYMGGRALAEGAHS
jgi:ABC-type branched-subunit amino acid transport system ATPase component/ABC-type branched-subunit amino acid transport system permease subunit